MRMLQLAGHTRKKALAQKEYRNTDQYNIRPIFKSPAVRVSIILGRASALHAPGSRGDTPDKFVTTVSD
jgi:hypothetical protein